MGEEGDKKGRIQYFVVVQWRELVEVGQFYLMSCTNNLSILIWGHVQNINSFTAAML